MRLYRALRFSRCRATCGPSLSPTARTGGSSVNTRQHALAEALRTEQNECGPHTPDPAKAGLFKEAVQRYNEDGFVVLRGVLDADLVGEMGAHVDWLARKYPDIPPEHYHHTIMRNDPFWLRVVSDRRLVDVAEGFLGSPGVALFSSHYFCKPPHTGQRVLWHQDGSYWPIRPMTVTTLWLAVDRSDADNGCLRVVRGSHKQRLHDLVADRSTQNVLGAATHTDAEVDEDKVVDLVLDPGDVSIHHPNIVHGSEPNTSPRRRCGLTIRFIPTSTECTQPEQPVMLLRGEAIPGINSYRSWPPFRPASDFAFRGAEMWNERRYVNPQDEWFFEQDAEAIERGIVEETLGFVDILGGRVVDRRQ